MSLRRTIGETILWLTKPVRPAAAQTYALQCLLQNPLEVLQSSKEASWTKFIVGRAMHLFSRRLKGVHRHTELCWFEETPAEMPRV